MKRVINQILLVVLLIIIGMSSVFITRVNAASIAGVAVSGAKEGEEFTVSLIIPNNVIGATCDIEVIYSDGSKQTKQLTYLEYTLDENTVIKSPNSVSFPAKVAGATKVNVTNIVLSDVNAQTIENGGSKEESLTIQPKQTSSSGGNSGSGSSNSGTSTSTNNQGGTTTDTPKEPEVVNPTFKDVNETVYAVSGCNVRSSCSSSISSNKIGGLKEGQSVTRTGYHSEWSRISYNGKTAYVATRLLTTEAPKVEEENTVTNTAENTAVKNEVTNKVENTVENEVVNEAVDQNAILGNLQNEIGVLPEVGRNVADYMFMIVSFITLSIIMIVNYKLKNKSL